MVIRLFVRQDVDNFNECFINWVNEFAKITKGKVFAIDGKTICGSQDKQIVLLYEDKKVTKTRK